MYGGKSPLAGFEPRCEGCVGDVLGLVDGDLLGLVEGDWVGILGHPAFEVKVIT